MNKLAKPGGMVIKKKHILAASDKHAIDQAAESPDCPICDVLRDGEKVGSIL
ncbi:MAG TPA: hypothetical protein VGU01_08240 [Sphingomicrobium sp.]|nr:hypothetical protein [Sphingomicrobium sp.]